MLDMGDEFTQVGQIHEATVSRHGVRGYFMAFGPILDIFAGETRDTGASSMVISSGILK